MLDERPHNDVVNIFTRLKVIVWKSVTIGGTHSVLHNPQNSLPLITNVTLEYRCFLLWEILPTGLHWVGIAGVLVEIT